MTKNSSPYSFPRWRGRERKQKRKTKEQRTINPRRGPNSSSHSQEPPPQMSPKAAAAEASSCLAPGFRFHPTDEELVLYYLKRKLLSRPLPLHAIPEVDLYKFDPWDLPDKFPTFHTEPQWYFFSPLDRKHAGFKARANRATGRGYWKMTGRDRAVRGGASGRVVGMKKTLVFHRGRAPKGQRTSWVMHEYRMADGEIANNEGADQDAYVVCRIFQKSARDPQNSGKYGAPLVEKRENDENVLTLCAEDNNGPLVDPQDEQVGQLDDYEQKSQCLKISGENAPCLVESGDGQVVFRCTYPTDVLGEAHDEPVLSDTGRNVNMPEQNSNLNLGENNDLSHIDHSASNDDYLELDDLAAPLELEYPADGPTFLFDGPCIDVPQTSSILELHGVDEFFDTAYETTIKEEEFLKDILNTSTDECISGEQADDDNIYFDAPTNIPMVEQDSFVEMTDFMAGLVAGQSAPDPMEELVAYFDATEGGMESPEYEDIITANGALKHSNEVLVTEQTCKSCAHLCDANNEAGASSSTATPFTANGDGVDPEDVPYKEGKDNIFKGNLANMLGSISCPPALAADMSTSLGLKGAAPQASNSIHVTAGMILIDSYIVDGSAILWSSQKAEGLGILFPCNMARYSVHHNLPILEKMDAGWLSWVARSGFGLCCFSVPFLALISKVGISIYTR